MSVLLSPAGSRLLLQNRKKEKKTALIFVAVLFFLSPSFLFSNTYKIEGILSGWCIFNNNRQSQTQLGLRYIPAFSIKKLLSKRFTFDLELSLNAYGSGQFNSLDNIQTDGQIKPYRMWFRFSSSQFQARIGLQRISFGSAALLRPLMWFDRIDPRDPLQLTDGVYGILLRYCFLNNTNIWLWGLYGNEKVRGWEIHPPDNKSPEIGGRFQFPFFSGEIALTYHHRKVNLSKSALNLSFIDSYLIPEDRYALDCKWDVGIGFWFEGNLIHKVNDNLSFPWQRNLNFGIDYTLGVGNGIYILGEYLTLKNSKEAFDEGDGMDFSAFLIRYPIGILDNVSGIFYYDWDNKELYSFVNWKREYDRLSFHIIAFWNPEKIQIYSGDFGNSLFRGKGFQFMLVFNH